MTPEDPRHGTNAGHKWGLPMCQPCRDAHAAQHRRYKATKYVTRLDRLLVDPTPTIRRVRALQAIGWTLAHLDRELGGSGKSNAVWNMLNQPSIHASTARRVDEVYQRLHMQSGPSKRTRDLAGNRGWIPPLAWDDIDDLNEQPTGWRRAS